MCMVGLVCAKSVGGWTISASGVVWVMVCRRMGGSGFCGSELLLLLLLEQIVVPVVLLPLCVHDDEVPAGTRVKTIASSCLSRLKNWTRRKGNNMYPIGANVVRMTVMCPTRKFMERLRI